MRSINAKQYVESKKMVQMILFTKKEIESQVKKKKKLMVTRGEKGEGINCLYMYI